MVSREKGKKVKLKITGCTNCSLWYSDHIGGEYEYIKTSLEQELQGVFYWVIDARGYKNIVYDKDCEIVE